MEAIDCRFREVAHTRLQHIVYEYSFLFVWLCRDSPMATFWPLYVCGRMRTLMMDMGTKPESRRSKKRPLNR